MNKTSCWLFCTVGGLLVTLFAHTAVCAQVNGNQVGQRAAANAQVLQAMRNAWLAESVVAMRESATGRRFDPTYRVSLKNALASLPTTRLETLQYTRGEGSLALDAIGDSSTNLVYTPVTPCRVFDTRSSPAGILAGDTQRDFLVAGNATGQFLDQGGASGGCGIPYGPATAVIINFAAVAPTGPGNLRAWAVAHPQPAAPLAAVMNFSTDMPVLANGVAVPICDPAATSCVAGDLRLQADISSIHVVGDVVGYFRRMDLPAAMPMSSDTLTPLITVDGSNYAIGTADVVLSHNGSCLVTCDLDIQASAQNNNGVLYLLTARRDVAAAMNVPDSGWTMHVPTPSIYGSASATYAWYMMAGTTYRFGCGVFASGDFIGETVYPRVSYLCR